MISLIKKLWGMEIIRYLFAGGTAFVFDNILVFNLFNMFLLPDLGEWMGMDVTNMISVTMGFIVGLLINNFMSMYLVFTSEEQKKNSRTAKAFWEFTVVGIIGLILSVGLIIILDLMDTTVRDEDYLNQKYDIPVLAVVPDAYTHKKGSYSYYRYGYGKNPTEDK